jgi:hypothetical protein
MRVSGNGRYHAPFLVGGGLAGVAKTGALAEAGFFASLWDDTTEIASRSDARNLTPNPFPRGKGDKILGEEAES